MGIIPSLNVDAFKNTDADDLLAMSELAGIIDEMRASRVVLTNLVKMSILGYTLPETPSRGGQIPEMIQVCDFDILIVLGELNTLI